MKTRKEVEYAGLFRKLSEWSSGYEEDYGDEFGNVEWDELTWQHEWMDLDDFRFRTVESFGGEGQGDSYWFVVEVEYADQIVNYRISGYYRSYDGGYYEDINVVKPKEEIITVWETV